MTPMTEPDRPPLLGVAALSDSLKALIAESVALRTDVAAAERARLHAERARRRENQIGLVLIGLSAVLMLVVAGIGWQGYQIARDTRATNEKVVDCTTPGGVCYQQGQARTGQAVDAVLKASVFVAECSRLRPGDSGPVFDAALEQCVAAKLSSHRPGTPVPTPAPTPSPTR
jgi:hypothetical protein